MKILELTNYSAGPCGVGARVKYESVFLSKKGHEVRIFSSNLTKGNNEIAAEEDKIDQVLIKRFPAKKIGGESYMKWDFKKDAMDFKPDVIIAHSYRHPHTLVALDIAKELGCKVFLVTHAPFGEGNRSLVGKLAVRWYDSFIGPRRRLKEFTKVIAISKWEIPFIKKLGVAEDKIELIPNGIIREFFVLPKNKEENKILYFGRVSPIKDIETLLSAFALIRDKKISLEIAGGAEEEYLNKLTKIVEEKKLGERVSFTGAVYKTLDKIKKLDSARAYILPSLREGMPQTLIEAMAREKIVIASKTQGAMDLIEDGKNGYLFEIEDFAGLAKKINLVLESDENKEMKKTARKSVEEFEWSRIADKIEKLINS
jgi:glycosyltransferase involved in cell wall biosynthesis